jgi:DNA-binding Xre family transcriptional regulator
MDNGMNSLHPIDDRMREAQYGRFAANVLRVLRDAVDRRVNEGETRTSLAARLGWNRSQLSRLLNGNVGNITIKSISDILWAVRFEPDDFEAAAHEDISPNYCEPMLVPVQMATLGDTIRTTAGSMTVVSGSMPTIQIQGGSTMNSHRSTVWVEA